MKTTDKPADRGGKNELSFHARYCGEVYIDTSNAYIDSGKIAVHLLDVYGDLAATLSVNIPERAHLLGMGEFFAKTWSENKEIAEDALASGIFRNTGRTSADTLNVQIWKFR